MSNVNHPSHYNTGRIEVIDFLEDQRLGFHLGNTVKYICRSAHKGKELEDLRKAAWYLNRYIDNLTRGILDSALTRAQTAGTIFGRTQPDDAARPIAIADDPEAGYIGQMPDREGTDD